MPWSFSKMVAVHLEISDLREETQWPPYSRPGPALVGKEHLDDFIIIFCVQILSCPWSNGNWLDGKIIYIIVGWVTPHCSCSVAATTLLTELQQVGCKRISWNKWNLALTQAFCCCTGTWIRQWKPHCQVFSGWENTHVREWDRGKPNTPITLPTDTADSENFQVRCWQKKTWSLSTRATLCSLNTLLLRGLGFQMFLKILSILPLLKASITGNFPWPFRSNTTKRTC